MKLRLRPYLIPTLVVLGITSTLVLIFRETVRQLVVMPMLYFLWLGSLIIRTIPDVVWWSLGLLIGAIIALQALFGKERAAPEPSYPPRVQERYSRLHYWLSMVRLMDASDFSRENFIFELRRLLLSILAYQESSDPAVVAKQVEAGEIVLPEEIRAFVLTRQMGALVQPPTFWERLGLSRKKHPVPTESDADLERIVKFMEERLEMNRDER